MKLRRVDTWLFHARASFFVPRLFPSSNRKLLVRVDNSLRMYIYSISLITSIFFPITTLEMPFRQQ